MNIELFNLKKCKECKHSTRVYLTLTHIDSKHIECKKSPGESALQFKHMLKFSQYICLFEKEMQFPRNPQYLEKAVELHRNCISSLNKSIFEMNEKFNVYINLKENRGV